MKQNPTDWYLEKLQEINIKIQDYNHLINRFSWLRVLSFLASLISFGFYASNQYLILLIASIGLFVLFVYFTIRHIKTSRKLLFLRSQALVLKHELGSSYMQETIYNKGNRFKSQLKFADDLDLFGEHSLFQQINRCSTPLGEDLLAHGLIHTLKDPSQIRLMQQAVKEFSAFAGFRIEMQTKLQLAASEKFPDLESIRETNLVRLFEKKKFAVIAFGLPAMVWISLIAGLLGFGYTPFSLIAVLSLMTVFSQSRKMMLLGGELDGLRHKFSSWAQVLEEFTHLSLDSEMMGQMQKEASTASEKFRELAGLSEKFDRRANLLLYVLSNLFFAFDIHLALRYETWREQNYLRIPQWLTTLGRFEMLMSLSTFAFNHPDYCWPQLSDQKILKAEALGHPLLPPEECVKNDVWLQLDPRILLITGSNMSGKSTWLRTLGVNVLLAQFGAPVMADSFVWKPVSLLSSLRQSDSLAEHTSLFMNELKQLKSILDTARKEFSLILLDEILRGTNSDDKYTGSYELLKGLSEVDSFTVIASHDLKLSELEQELGGILVNYCFESSIIDGKLSFDYTIRKGVAVNRNATWLMKDMGII